MSKIYGYREEDVKNLYDYLKLNKYKTLSQAFSDFGALTGKSNGTVRNLYYAMAKKGREDEDFKNEFLCGKNLNVNKAEPFKKEEETDLLEKIEQRKKEGCSVRKAVIELSGGDVKLALRYQNKYRNALSAKREEKQEFYATEKVKSVLSDVYFKKLKNAVDSMIDGLLENVKKENVKLKEQVDCLERENRTLRETVADSGLAGRYFKGLAGDGSAVN